MGGFLALWHLDAAPLEREAFAAVLGRFGARPHDSIATWRGDTLGLAERRLHTTPGPGAEHGLALGRNGAVVVAADVRLDNREALIAALGLPGPHAAVSDAHLIVRGWERWGEALPEHLLGDFAFVVWDHDRRRMFCARDPLGVRPFYYHRGPRLFAAASDTATLLAMPGVPRDLDEVRLASFLVPGFEERTRTFYAAITRLPAAHALAIAPTGGAPREYWRLDPDRAEAPATDEEYAETFRALFTDAVRARMRTPAPLAAALSGGLDSSSVACAARDMRRADGGGPLLTCSARFPTLPACDEGAHIAAVLGDGGMVNREFRGDLLDPLGEMETGRTTAQDTLLGVGYYMHGALFRCAREWGARVVLEGMSGDAVVGHGTGYLRSLASGGRWWRLIREIAQFRRDGAEPMSRTVRSVGRQVLPASLLAARRRRHHRRIGPSALLQPGFTARVQLDERLRAAALPPLPAGVDGTRLAQHRLLTSDRMAVIFETLASLAADAGVDVRDPFADRRLVEFCLGLPTSMKVRNGRTRVVLRQAMARELPPLVRERRGKGHLSVMLRAALDVYGPERLAALMTRAEGALEPYVSPGSVLRASAAWRANPSDGNRNRMWRLAALTLWLEGQGLRQPGGFR